MSRYKYPSISHILVFLGLLTAYASQWGAFVRSESELRLIHDISIGSASVEGLGRVGFMIFYSFFFSILSFADLTQLIIPLMKAFSLLFTTLTVLASGHLFYYFLGDKRLSLFAAAFFALSPPMFYASSSVRPDAPMLFFSICAMLSFARWLDTGRFNLLITSGFSMGLSISFGWESLFALPFFPFYFLSKKKTWMLRDETFIFSGLILVVGFFGPIYLALTKGGFLKGAYETAYGFSIRLISGLTSFDGIKALHIGTASFVFGISGFLLLTLRRGFFLSLTLLSLTVPFAIFFITGIRSDLTFSFFMLGFSPLMINLIWQTLELIVAKKARSFGIALIALILISGSSYQGICRMREVKDEEQQLFEYSKGINELEDGSYIILGSMDFISRDYLVPITKKGYISIYDNQTNPLEIERGILDSLNSESRIYLDRAHADTRFLDAIDMIYSIRQKHVYDQVYELKQI